MAVYNIDYIWYRGIRGTTEILGETIAYEITTSFITAKWYDIIQSTRVILHPPGVRWDFLALVKMAEKHVWYARNGGLYIGLNETYLGP